MIILFISVISVFIIVALVYAYMSQRTKTTIEERLELQKEHVKNIVNNLTQDFHNNYNEYTKKCQECDKLNKTKAIWFDSADDDPQASENIKDIEAQLLIIEGRISYKKSVLNWIVKEIVEDDEVFQYIRSNDFNSYKKIVLWKQNHQEEISSIKNKKK